MTLRSLAGVVACAAAAVTATRTITQAADTWPGFRGLAAAGVANGQRLPEKWNGTTGAGIRWKVELPGLAHSSPIVWGDRVFVTTAISSRPGATFKPGLYGAGTASEDRTVHEWVVMAFDRRNGNLVWKETAYRGEPKEKRHIKATYANATPYTDGRYVVAFFGSQGLYAFDMNGKPVWKKDLGVLNTGAYDLPEYEWGTASSPILYKDMVIVQCDTQGESFLLAADVRTGTTIWKTVREELPSWGTPNVYQPARGGAPELVTNASNYVRGYDPDTGVERWRLGGSSKITAPTPVFSDGLFIVASGRAPERPIFAQPCRAEEHDRVVNPLPLKRLQRLEVLGQDTQRPAVVAVEKGLVLIGKHRIRVHEDSSTFSSTRPRRRSTSFRIARSSRARTTRTRTRDPGAATSWSALLGASASSGSSSPANRRARVASRRTRALFSPIPPVNTTASTPPRTPAIAPSARRMERTKRS